MESPEDMANDSMRLSSARQLASTRYRVAPSTSAHLISGVSQFAHVQTFQLQPIGSCSSRGFPGYGQPADPLCCHANTWRSPAASGFPRRYGRRSARYGCRLDPVIVREWRQLTANRDSTANRHSATKWGAAASDNAIAGSGCRSRRRTGNRRRIRVDRKPLRHPRGAGAGESVARWRICAEVRVVGVANPIISEY